MVNPRRPSADNAMLPDEIDDDNVIAQNLSTSIRCQEYEAFSASKNYFGDVNVRLFILYFLLFQPLKCFRLCAGILFSS